MINQKRLEEIFYLFSRILPISPDPKQRNAVEKALGIKLDELLPAILLTVAKECSKLPDEAEGYLDWMAEGILYIKEESDSLPNTVIEFTGRKTPL